VGLEQAADAPAYGVADVDLEDLRVKDVGGVVVVAVAGGDVVDAGGGGRRALSLGPAARAWAA